MALDTGVLSTAGLLILLGVVMSYSTTAALTLEHRIPPLFLNHLIALCLGGAAAAATLWLPTAFWRTVSLPLWLISMLLLIATCFFGIEVNGAQRWLEIPIIHLRFQPVEVVKFTTLLVVASVVAHRDGHNELSRRRALVASGLGLAPAALLLLQPDLGNAVLLFTSVVLVLIVAGTPLRILVAPALVTIVAVAIYIVNTAYTWSRVTCFLNPWKDPYGACYQLVQSFVAFGRGGLFGVGLGNGHQKLAFLPEAHTDFILALVAEEMGLLGVLVVLGAFAALCLAGGEIARKAPDRFHLLLAVAMTALITLPAAVNAAVVMGVVPTKGLTLPFLSHGGTSLVMCCAVLGLLLRIGRAGGASRETPVVGSGGGRRPTWG